MTTPLSPQECMQLAMKKALEGWGNVSPNPLVGCVIVDENHQLLSTGYHKGPGQPHAEIDALNNLQDQSLLRGSTVYVNLEPCAHYGRTPPCAETLARLPIKKVVYALQDPNPLVNGKGASILKSAGKEVQFFEEFHAEAAELNKSFLINMTKSRAYIALKVAQSLDGQLGHKSGASQWITNELAREKAHYLRAGHDAVMVGVNTFLKDNPKLNIRHPSFVDKKNIAVIIDPDLRGLGSIKGSQILGARKPEDVVFVGLEKVVGSRTRSEHGCRLIGVPARQSSIDLQHLVRLLYDQEIRSIYVEGGGATLSQFLMQNIGDHFYGFVAPVLIGAASGIAWTHQLNIQNFEDKIKIRKARYETLGDNIFVSGGLEWQSSISTKLA